MTTEQAFALIVLDYSHATENMVYNSLFSTQSISYSVAHTIFYSMWLQGVFKCVR